MESVPRPVSVPKGMDLSSALRCRLIGNCILRQQLLKYANTPLEEDWEMAFLSALFALRLVGNCLFATVLWDP